MGAFKLSLLNKSKVFNIAFQATVLFSVFNCGLGYHTTNIIAEHGMQPVTKFLQVGRRHSTP